MSVTKIDKTSYYGEIIQWLQKNYMEVPGTVSVKYKEVYQHFSTSCNATVSSKIFGQIARQIFGNMRVLKDKYYGLRPNFLEDKACTSTIISEIASTLGYFPMPSEKCVSKFGFVSGFCANRYEILKVVEIFPDNTYQLYVGGRSVNPEEIGLNGLCFYSYFDAKTILNTFKQCSICQGKCVSSNTDANKFSIVQEWSKSGDKKNIELRRTSRKCHGVLSFAKTAFHCKQCSTLKDDMVPPNGMQLPAESREDLLKRLFPGASKLMTTFMKLQSVISCDENDEQSVRWNKEIIQALLSVWKTSPEAYSILRNSGILILPSESLLSSYINCKDDPPRIKIEVVGET